MNKEYKEITVFEASKILSFALSENDRPLLAFKDGHDWIMDELTGIDVASDLQFKTQSNAYSTCAKVEYPDLTSKNYEIETVYFSHDGRFTFVYHYREMIAKLEDDDAAATELLLKLDAAGIIEAKEINAEGIHK